MPTSLDVQTSRVLDSLRRLVRALRSSSHQVRRTHQVSVAQLFVLRELGEAPGMSLGELAQRTYTRQNTVSEVVSLLVRRRLVVRKIDPSDGRRHILRLTAAGKAVVRGSPPSPQEALKAAMGRLSAADRRSLADGLAHLVRSAGLDTVEPGMLFEPLARKRTQRSRTPT